MNIEVIKASDAPASVKKRDDGKSAFVDALRGLKAGQVLRITPDAGRSLRGTRQGLTRIATTAGLRIETWDDGEKVYVKQIGFVVKDR